MDIITGTLELNERELVFVRQALDIVQIQGKDAPFLTTLMYKVEQEIKEVYELTNKSQQAKAKGLQEALDRDAAKEELMKNKAKA
jgi:hypothetical protein